MASPYRHISRESQIATRVMDHMKRISDYAVHQNPLPIGEERIDPRTAKKRLDQIPPSQLHDYLRELG